MMQAWHALIRKKLVTGIDPAALNVSGGATVLRRVGALRSCEIDADAAEQSVAVEDVTPSEHNGRLGRIKLALGALGAAIDIERKNPSKQHGLP
jgi:hypothetical protein